MMRSIWIVLYCMILQILVMRQVVSAGENWPSFRGPTNNGISDAGDLPVEWSESKNIQWKTAVHDRGWSTPVIWENQIWVTTATEDGHNLYAVNVDFKSGKIIHDKLCSDQNNQNEYQNLRPYLEIPFCLEHRPQIQLVLSYNYP